MNALHEQFVTEARDLIRRATDQLIALERYGASDEAASYVLRALHTLKGSAGIVELPAMSITLHAAEDLVAGLREGTLVADSDIIDAVMACLDQVSHWVDEFEAAGVLPFQAGEDGRAMAERLRSFLTNAAADPVAPASREPAGSAGELPSWIARLIAAISSMPEPPGHATAILYEPAVGCFYNGDDPLQLMRQVPGLAACHIEAREPFAALSEIDPYACNMRFQALSIAEREDISRIFRLVPDQVRLIGIPRQALPAANAAQPSLALVRNVLEAQREMLNVPGRKADLLGCIGSAVRAAANALRYGAPPELAEAVLRGGALATAQQTPAPLLEALEQALTALAAVPSTLSDTRLGQPQARATNEVERAADRVLRVGAAKVDALVNLAGELVVAKNALARSARRVEQELGGTEISRAVERDREAIERLVTELHGAVLQLRMIEAAQLFRSFPRLIRDVARQLDKKVALVTRGETTEFDKSIMDRLFEPMVHLLRNALDHGIENPEQRHAAGKPETATISIAASRAGDRLLIEVADDGRGIDPAAIRKRASENRLLAPDELDALTDEQAIDLVFSAGFSTAPALSDISGRGIGMDAVRSGIEQMGGRVALESWKGIGTTVRLDLPTTVSMSRIMLVETGGQLFGISMDAVSETVRVTPDRISRVKKNYGVILRERVVPIVSLAERMKLPERARDQAAPRLLVIVESAGKIVAFEVDAIRDRLDVVLKPMQGLLEGVRGFAGTTLLGNGQVLLVLDAKELLQ
ncbi:chemotaxis protein CheA [Bradyrhizobium glycinis]|uniref:chemotaxis protein CheA n=1 Tax=Bradyrhizobium glycinis TaxID=2751812 RepID=UPI0018D7D9DA|nr:chemotaxis protein CheA [Bradyrhizobium glycinis]MBH5370562.1 chemotaxis protein CheA [Bradyrhizobium glycinis]